MQTYNSGQPYKHLMQLWPPLRLEQPGEGGAFRQWRPVCVCVGVCVGVCVCAIVRVCVYTTHGHGGES